MKLRNPFRRKSIREAELEALERDLDHRLAVRRAARSKHSQAAHKGWETRRAAL